MRAKLFSDRIRNSAFAGCTVIYFITAFFYLPETKGKTSEEIEAYIGSAQEDIMR